MIDQYVPETNVLKVNFHCVFLFSFLIFLIKIPPKEIEKFHDFFEVIGVINLIDVVVVMQYELSTNLIAVQ